MKCSKGYIPKIGEVYIYTGDYQLLHEYRVIRDEIDRMILVREDFGSQSGIEEYSLKSVGLNGGFVFIKKWIKDNRLNRELYKVEKAENGMILVEL